MSCCAVISNPGSGAHDLPGHPECEARLLNAMEGVPASVRQISASMASVDEMARIHDRSYIERVQDLCRTIRTPAYIDPDTYITPASFSIAAGAAGSAMAAVEQSLKGEHSFALIRPPGHHAERAHSLGFCIFNNVAIAAASAISAGRVAIVDWDYHHGNGTQHAFYSSGRVLFCSVHDGGAFPFTGSYEETGSGSGTGCTINAPLAAGSSIADYRMVFSEIFCPAISRFDPDVVIVSAGQDILSDDPLGRMQVFPQDFEVLVHSLQNASPVPLALVLEGGYSRSHGTAISHIFRALSSGYIKEKDNVPRLPLPETARLVARLRTIHNL